MDLSVAEKHYKNHLLAVHRYENKNRDKIREKNRNYYSKLKNENSDKFNELLDYHKNIYTNNKDSILDKRKEYYILNKDRQKLYYQNVVKPKLLLKKQNILLQSPTL
jgi:hypothetical protein